MGIITSQDLQLGLNSFTVSSVSFDRYVKFQFSSGDIDFNSIVHNGNTIDLSSGCSASSTQSVTIIHWMTHHFHMLQVAIVKVEVIHLPT